MPFRRERAPARALQVREVVLDVAEAIEGEELREHLGRREDERRPVVAKALARKDVRLEAVGEQRFLIEPRVDEGRELLGVDERRG